MIKLVSLLLSLLISFTAQSNTLLIIGDSLSAGYNMPVEESWPVFLPKKLQQQGLEITVVNASISGDTSGNALARLPGLLSKHQPDYVLLELGANDGLRGFSPNIVTNNLSVMIDNIKSQNAQPILMQIQVPTNYGKRYSNAFADIYPALSKEKDIPLMPFYLEQVIVKPEWMQSDGLHPNAKAQQWIAEFIAKELKKILTDLKQ
ncbi:multifunctional acyl-CoA thioesterase I/protease I/lysophospholipase L1 [Psychromonas algicola]|uniref:multifunctional acyl-CoA thioesterase I/protease I/lysophospholipase L1 n=1 Tax=Psychromonas algicola TaxID=2555642 RepID=UPI001068474A|nr:multifunctional acyl-CoA thioesterase I/protease I/lysophospholipase L1 [Psychromonas sp. RZ5]TEW43161.1 multifunctional acyl-CoA thioesterase I/protease I/lysophospholipase L1 [Psychromonas sp. RZ5]